MKRLPPTHRKCVSGVEANKRAPTGMNSVPRANAVIRKIADRAVATRFSREKMKADNAPTTPPGMRKVTMRIMVRVAAMTMRATSAPRPG